MATLVLYYSFTGHTRKTAEALAQAMGAELCEITCPTYTSGFLGPWRQAIDVLLRRSVPIEVPEKARQDWDLVVVGGPVWGARPAPPIRGYLKTQAGRHARLGLFVTCGGTSPKFPPSTAIAEMTGLAKTVPVSTHIFTEADIASDAFSTHISDFVKDLGAAT